MSIAPETFTYTSGGIDLTLDVFTSPTPAQRCAVLLVHGGAWRFGSPDLVHDRAIALAERGFTAIAVQYRLLDAAPWPAPLEDMAAALGWVRANAVRLNIDPARVVVQGHSTGGHIALMTGTLPAKERPAAIAAFYPAIGFHNAPPPTIIAGVPVLELDDLGRVPGWMMLPAEASTSELSAASPYDLLDASFPPTIIFHGGADTTINVRSSIAVRSRLTELRVPSELHIYADLGHEFDAAPTMTHSTATTTALFLNRFVTDRETAQAEASAYAFTIPSAK